MEIIKKSMEYEIVLEDTINRNGCLFTKHLKTYFMKKNLYVLVTLLTVSLAANAQTKNMEMKKKFNFMQRFHQTQNFSNQNQLLRLKINPYWESINAPHTYNSFMQNVKVPAYNCVWATVNYDSLYYNANKFLRTADGGKTWRYDSINTPGLYGLISIAPVDGNTCYAAMYNANVFLGGGIFKTVNGGATWKQLEPGKLFNSTSFPDFVYFFNAQYGLAVGDNNGDTSRLEIYTTDNAGATWLRVPNKNIPPISRLAYAASGSSYAVYKNTFWFRGYDENGNVYVYRSDDFGNHWQLFPYTLSTPIYDFVFIDKLNGMGVSFDENGVHEVVTHNGGKTWNDKSYTGYLMAGWITQIPFTHTLVSTLPSGFTPVSGSSYSNDYGSTWHLIDSGINAEHTEAHFLNPFEGWTGSAGLLTSDGGVYKWKLHFSLDDKAIAANDDNNSSATKNDLSNTINARLYPNPAKDIITVNGLSTSAKATLSLYNNSGALIQQATANSEHHSFNLQQLAAGSYYIKVQSGEKISTLKFVKQ